MNNNRNNGITMKMKDTYRFVGGSMTSHDALQTSVWSLLEDIRNSRGGMHHEPVLIDFKLKEDDKPRAAQVAFKVRIRNGHDHNLTLVVTDSHKDWHRLKKIPNLLPILRSQSPNGPRLSELIVNAIKGVPRHATPPPVGEGEHDRRHNPVRYHVPALSCH